MRTWRERREALMAAPTPPPPHELLKSFADMLASPAQTKQAIADLLAASAANKETVANAVAEQEKSAKAEEALFVAREKHFSDCDKREAEGAAKLSKREADVTAREKAVTAREAEAEKLLTRAKEQDLLIRKKMQAFDAVG